MGEIPPVSVILPVHNGAHTFSEAIRSVLRQSLREFELIVIDDGSDDATPRLLKDISQEDRRLRCLRLEHQGLPAALNAGLAEARGAYVARMDADDICEPTRLERQLAYLRNNPTCVAVGTAVTLIDEGGRPLARQPKVPRSPRLRDRCRGFRHFPPSPPTIVHPTAVLRAEALRRAGGYRHYFPCAEDRDLWWRISTLGRIDCLRERLLRRRVHVRQSSNLHK